MKTCDVVLIGYAVNSTSGGYTNRNVKYVDTVGIKYLYSHFYGTYCAEPVAFLQLVRRLIASIKVVSAEKLIIQFQSGIVMEQEIRYE